MTKAFFPYRVWIEYTLSPSTACWVLGIVLFFCIIIIGGAIIFVPALEKSKVADVVASALRDLKEDTDARYRR